MITSLSFSGGAGGNTSYIGTGGTLRYTSNIGGVYEVVISFDGLNFDPGIARNRVLRGVRGAGAQTVTWDGKANDGSNFPVGNNYAFHAHLHAGEYHFPLIDAENSTLGGPSFRLLNPPGGSCPLGCTTGFFDDRGYRTVGSSGTDVGTPPPPDTPLCGVAPPASPYHSSAVTGYDTTSATRAYGTDTGGNVNVPCNGSFGDVKGLDTWTFFPSALAASALNIVTNGTLSGHVFQDTKWQCDAGRWGTESERADGDDHHQHGRDGQRDDGRERQLHGHGAQRQHERFSNRPGG